MHLTELPYSTIAAPSYLEVVQETADLGGSLSLGAMVGYIVVTSVVSEISEDPDVDEQRNNAGLASIAHDGKAATTSIPISGIW